MKDKTIKKGNLRLRYGFPSNYHIEAVISFTIFYRWETSAGVGMPVTKLGLLRTYSYI